MNVLILGDDPEARAWAAWFAARPEHQILAVAPALAEGALATVPVFHDLDEAMATAGVALAIVGGSLESRAESLRRAAAEGLAIICIHPPGIDSEAYYQVALSRAETGAVVVPNLPLRLHPGMERLRQAIRGKAHGGLRLVRLEAPAGPEEGDLARRCFPALADAVRSLLGEFETLTASGDPPGDRPDLELVVQLRATGGGRAEIRAWPGRGEPARLTVFGATGSLTLEYAPEDLARPARLIDRPASSREAEQVETLEPWDPHAAILDALVRSLPDQEETTPAPSAFPGPTLEDGTRAMELSEAVVRSLRRGRTIDLHYESISEEATFKSVMTSTGCVILLGTLLLLPAALAGPALGLPWTIFLAYLIPPVLVLFVVTQLLRFGIGGQGTPPPQPGERPRPRETTAMPPEEGAAD